MSNKRFRFEHSHDLPDWWVVTDLINKVVIRFRDADYNNSQKISFLDDDAAGLGAAHLATIVKEIGEYIVRYHGSAAFGQPYGYEYTDDEQLCIYRRKHPRWRLLIDDNTNNAALASSLCKAAEWLTKGQDYERVQRRQEDGCAHPEDDELSRGY